MKGDFSTWNFDDRSDNLNHVLHQQGRVLLDSDWNAQTDLLNDWQTTAAQDVIGFGVAAVPMENPDAFKVLKVSTVASQADRVTLTIQPGRIWADGFLVHLASSVPLSREAIYLRPPIQDPAGQVEEIKDGIRDAVILEVWQEALNGFQKPETLIESALGGPDTTERVQTSLAWRLYRLAEEETCESIRDRLQDDWEQKGHLTVTLRDPTITDGDCPVVSAGGYTGFEHFLYRVEIAHAKEGTKFKWSQCNGGLVGRGVFQAANGGQPGKVAITHNLPAIIHAGIRDFYLEVIEYDESLGHQTVLYGAMASLNHGNELELATVPTFGTQPVSPDPPLGELPKTYFFRLWNGIADVASFAVSPAQLLQDGILLTFEDPTSLGKTYTPGDYWTFKVRAGEIPNPSPLVDCQPPEGILYHRVSIAELNWTGASEIHFAEQDIEDCRKPFRPLTNQKVCCTFSVGDGKRSHGDFDAIADALRHLPPSGGKICVLPGIHSANVDIIHRHNIQITGCGAHSIIHPIATEDENPTNAPIFRIAFSHHIQIDHLTLVTISGTAIQVLDSLELLPPEIQQSHPTDSSSIHLLWNTITASLHGIEIRTRNETQAGNNDIWIAHNQLFLIDTPTGKATILSIADGVLIERNRLLVVPPIQEDDPQEPRQPDEPSGGAFDPCKPPRFYYGFQLRIYKFVRSIGLYAAKALVVQKPTYVAQGGIQIGSSSDGVKVIGNAIIGGWGNGITLGHLPEGILDDNLSESVFAFNIQGDRLKALQEKFVSTLYNISIEENTIQRMGLSGIGIVSFLNLETVKLMVQVNDLTIYRNRITQCAQQIPLSIPAAMIGQVGFGGIALAGCDRVMIQENQIKDNGISSLDPICGIFILFGDRIEISNNHILNNGEISKKGESDLPRQGLRGGIFISLSLASRVGEFVGTVANIARVLPLDDGIPAVKVHGNVVTQPLGQALFVIAIGPVSVVGNQFTSQDVDTRANLSTLFAGAVLILNLGFTIQEFVRLALFRANQFGKMPYTAPQAIAETQDSLALQPDILAALVYGLFWPSGKVMFNDNQTTLDLRAIKIDFLLSSQLILTLDDIGFSSNQSDCNTLIDLLITNTFLVGFSIRTNDNRFREGLIFTLLSLFSLGVLNTNTYNQGSHCFLALASSAQLRVNRDNIVLFDQLCRSLVSALTERYG